MLIAVTLPTWIQWSLRIMGWAVWQIVVLVFAFLVYVNLFSEYGAYSHPIGDPVAAVLIVAAALFLGTWLPIREWRADRQNECDDPRADDENGGA